MPDLPCNLRFWAPCVQGSKLADCFKSISINQTSRVPPSFGHSQVTTPDKRPSAGAWLAAALGKAHGSGWGDSRGHIGSAGTAPRVSWPGRSSGEAVSDKPTGHASSEGTSHRGSVTTSMASAKQVGVKLAGGGTLTSLPIGTTLDRLKVGTCPAQL